MIRPSLRRRSGFTLIELMVVIVIISILIALILPAISGAVRQARSAQVSSEIQTLATALASFKEKYGDYPPSRIILSETGVYPATTDATALSAVTTWYGSGPSASGSTDITLGTLSERSQRYVRKFWPRADFVRPASSPFTGASGSYYPDFNGNGGNGTGTPDSGLIYLQGYECLAFFLGGIPNPSSGTFGMTGFAKDTRYPFKNALLANTNTAQTTTNRYNPFYEFRGERLIDDDGDGIPGYIDPLGTLSDARFYAYFSAYGNGFYDPNDCNGGIPVAGATVEMSNLTGNPTGNSFALNFPPGGTISPSPNPYTSSFSAPGGSQSTTFFNTTSYQIISAGGDRYYGSGGQFAANGAVKFPPTLGTPPVAPPDDRAFERDNLTNFATGRLE